MDMLTPGAERIARDPILGVVRGDLPRQVDHCALGCAIRAWCDAVSSGSCKKDEEAGGLTEAAWETRHAEDTADVDDPASRAIGLGGRLLQELLAGVFAAEEDAADVHRPGYTASAECNWGRRPRVYDVPLETERERLEARGLG